MPPGTLPAAFRSANGARLSASTRVLDSPARVIGTDCTRTLEAFRRTTGRHGHRSTRSSGAGWLLVELDRQQLWAWRPCRHLLTEWMRMPGRRRFGFSVTPLRHVCRLAAGESPEGAKAGRPSRIHGEEPVVRSGTLARASCRTVDPATGQVRHPVSRQCRCAVMPPSDRCAEPIDSVSRIAGTPRRPVPG